jgi:aminoglycoside phosphotransferase (APT) family kinase protein
MLESSDWRLPPGTANWVESSTGGTIIDAERQGRWRPHWRLTVKTPSGEQELLLRGPRDPELIATSQFLSYFSIAREARVLAALQGSGIPVPRMYGFHADTDSILMEWVPGASFFNNVQDPDQVSAAQDYFKCLAKLHSLPIDRLNLDDIELPTDAIDVAEGKFRLQEADYLAARPSLPYPEPLLDYGRWWLRQHTPPAPSQLSLVQGDTGPGQYLHAHGRVTALIDWELAHVGDPMLDLGNARMRNLLYPMGDLNPHLRAYTAERGLPLDVPALQYYTVMSMLLSPIGMAASIQRPDAGIPSMIPRFGWDVTLRKGLCQALAEAIGFALIRPDLSATGRKASSWLTRYLSDHIRTQCVSSAVDAEQSFQLRSALALAETVELAEIDAAVLAADDLDDMAEVLGERPEDRDSGLVSINRLVEDRPEGLGEKLIPAFYRMECRREHLLRPLMVAQTSGDLIPLDV